MADIQGDTNDGDANDAVGVVVDIFSSMCRQMADNDRAIPSLQRQASASSSVSACELHEQLAAELHEELGELQEDIDKQKEKRIALKSCLENLDKEVSLLMALTQKLQGLRHDVWCFVPWNNSMLEQLGELREVVNKETERRMVLQKSYEGLEKEVALTKDVTENLLGVVPRITSQIKSAKSLASSAASASHREGDREHKRRHGSKHLDQSRKRQRRQSGERRRY